MNDLPSQQMKVACILTLVSLSINHSALAHPGHDGHASRAAGGAAAASTTGGQGRFTFRYSATKSSLPDEAKAKLHLAHGGFAVDPTSGEVFFGLKGVGIVWMSNDLEEKRVLPVKDPALVEGNFHNTTILHRDDGKRFLALPDNEKGRVFITTDRGELVTTLESPTQVNGYYAGGGQFNPTDTEYAGQQLYVADGYSPGNFILRADPWKAQWTSAYFGGKATAREYGLFGTAHGVTFNRTTRRLEISDRANSRIQAFDLQGTYLGTTALPAGSLPCDVDFHRGNAVVGCLKGPEGRTPAPFYILDRDGKLVSEVNPKRDFGLERFTHIHNATWKVELDAEGETKSTFVLATAWNPGDFAVFELVE